MLANAVRRGAGCRLHPIAGSWFGFSALFLFTPHHLLTGVSALNEYVVHLLVFFLLFVHQTLNKCGIVSFLFVLGAFEILVQEQTLNK